MRHFAILFATITFLLSSCDQATPPAPCGPLPAERQFAWHQLEYYAFIHFNMNTFTNMEWGMGSEKPEQFNPTQLDTRQWAKVCKDAGMKAIIITAKHHDGFCLWPSAYTEHSVKNSPWKNGKGDVVRDLSEACKEFGLKFGVYLSPWDRNHAEYGREAYNEYFRNQLRELLTNYGDIFEVWFDGANGGTGWYGGANEERRIDRKTYYKWDEVFEIVRELQPNACIFSDGGPDVRWVGNEEGWARPTNWCLLKRDDFAPGIAENIEHLRGGQEDGTHWVPAEVDVSIRPGWYYHPYEDHKVKTLSQLLDIYYHSVGRNASFLLNLPVDTRGLVHENDRQALIKLAEALKADFATDLLKEVSFEASNVRGNSKKFSARNVTDGNPETYWATDDGVVEASLTFDFGKPMTFNRFLAQEYIALGQRVKQFKVEAFVNDSWKIIAEETTIGSKRILRFPAVTATKIRFSVEDAKACPAISTIQVFNAPKALEVPTIRRNKEGVVSITSADSSVPVYYTTDGTQPDENSRKYSETFTFAQKGIVSAVVFDPTTKGKSPVARQEFDIPATKWQLLGEQGKDSRAATIFDGNPNTALIISKKMPADFIIDLGEAVSLCGFRYLPDQSRGNSGVIRTFELSTSLDGRNFGSPVSSGEFGNIENSPTWQQVHFEKSSARYVRFRALETVDKSARAGIAEINFITE
ncbi:MAG: alpha-L-fucosidase [Prolixibacteraceae bacterium]|nr:alpha-L-fucosidase [Prolixibacteraceae bacterium]